MTTLRGLAWKSVREMRVWHLPLEYLDDRRLLAQHHEVHGLITAILSGKRWGQWSTLFGQRLPYLFNIHEEAVQELARRAQLRSSQHKHSSPVLFTEEQLKAHSAEAGFNPTDEMMAADVVVLRGKWAAEGYFHGTGRTDLCLFEAQLNLPLGPDPAAAQLIRTATKAFVLKHKGQLRTMKGTLAARLKEIHHT